jgi:hypothetical protein
MKNKERIAILETEISRLKVANRNVHERLAPIEGKLGIEVPRPARSAVVDAMLNRLIAKAKQRKSESNSSEIPNTCEPITPDFIPDWKDAPEDAVCVAMDEDGEWNWWTQTPIAFKHNMAGEIWGVMGATIRLAFEAGKATNAHLLPPDYWKGTLMMRPDANAGDWATAPDWAMYKAMDKNEVWNWYSDEPYRIEGVLEWQTRGGNDKYKLIPNHPPSDKDWTETLEMRPESISDAPDYIHLLPDGYEFCDKGEHEKFVKVEIIDGVDEDEQNELGAISQTGGKQYLPIRKSSPDYSHLLPDGYEFCSEADAEKWVKVENDEVAFDIQEIGLIHKAPSAFGTWLPIRPIQYKVTTHEIVNAVPDPYQPDWSQAPEGTVAHAWDEDGRGFWCMVNIDEYTEWVLRHTLSHLTLPTDLDWRQSLRVKPN